MVAPPSAPPRVDARAIVLLAAPAVAQSLLQTLVFLVDRVMLGHHSETALASLQASGPLLWTLQSVFSAFSAGTIAVVGRSVGAGDRRAAAGALSGSLAIAVALGVVAAVFGLALLGPMVSAIAGSAGAAVEAEAREYLAVTLPALPALFVGLVATSTLQASGDTRTPLALAVLTNAAKILGNWVLVFGHLGAPRLGARGAGLATALALVLEAALGLAALSRERAPVRLSLGWASAREGARRVLAVAWGAFGERLIYHAGYLGFVRITNGLGAAAMAAHQAVLSVESVSFLSSDGFAVASGALVSRSLGAGDAEAARRAAWRTAALCAGLLALFGLTFVALPEHLVAAFGGSPEARALGVGALRTAALAQVPMAFCVVLGQSLRASGATREALAVTFVGALFVRLAATWCFVVVLRLGLVGVWLGSASDWLVRAAIFAWRWHAGAWARTRV